MKIKWLDEPQKHDYPAAVSYLSLIMDEQAANTVVRELENADMTQFMAKDILRAAGLSSLGVSKSRIARDAALIEKNEKLSPVLLYRDIANGRLVVADGYHRLCAVYKVDEDAMIPCKIV